MTRKSKLWYNTITNIHTYTYNDNGLACQCPITTLEMPGASKDHIETQTYENSTEIFNDHPQRRSQVIKISQVADIKTIRATYKNGILEMVFKKKEKPKLNNKLRWIEMIEITL